MISSHLEYMPNVLWFFFSPLKYTFYQLIPSTTNRRSTIITKILNQKKGNFIIKSSHETFSLYIRQNAQTAVAGQREKQVQRKYFQSKLWDQLSAAD